MIGLDLHSERTKVIDLFGRVDDRKKLQQITEIVSVESEGPMIKIRLKNKSLIDIDWMKSLSWAISDRLNRQTVSIIPSDRLRPILIVGKHCDDLVEVFLGPVLPSLGARKTWIDFEIRLTGPTGLTKTFRSSRDIGCSDILW
jgi:hypothetical protein